LRCVYSLPLSPEQYVTWGNVGDALYYAGQREQAAQAFRKAVQLAIKALTVNPKDVLQATIPRAVSARYDRRSGHVVVHLTSKLIVSFSPRDAQGLEDATATQLDEIEISPSGCGIYFRSWMQTSTCQVY